MSLLAAIDIEALPAAERTALMALKYAVTDVRLDIRDYGMAASKAEQDRLAATAKQRLEQLDAHIAAAGGLGLLGSADVAQLSALAQQLVAIIEEE